VDDLFEARTDTKVLAATNDIWILNDICISFAIDLTQDIENAMDMKMGELLNAVQELVHR